MGKRNVEQSESRISLVRLSNADKFIEVNKEFDFTIKKWKSRIKIIITNLNILYNL